MKEQHTYETLLAENTTLREEKSTLQTKVRRQEERIAYLERMLFGSKSDKLVKKCECEGPGLFDDFFAKELEEREAAMADAVEEIKKEAATRREKRKKEPSRPARYMYHGLKEEWRTEYPEGADPSLCDVIGEDVTRTLHYRRAVLWVECVRRPVLRPKADRTALYPRIMQAPAPRPAIGGNHAGADLLTQIVLGKYSCHIPEYRQARMYAALGAQIPTSTINGWVHAVANRLYPLYESQQEAVLSCRYIQADEVPWRIADRVGECCRKGYAWQFLDAGPDSRGTYFYYYKGSRGGEVPRSQLRDFKGAIQTDGYRAYDYFESQDGAVLLACMAHARRKFVEAQKSHPAQAAKAVEYIGLLYTLEGNLRARGASAKEKASERQAKALPIMKTMETWMKAVCTQCLPDDPLGKALDYAYKLWPRLERYALDGDYQIDNNAVERGQRPSVMGRKNYLFSKSDRGAEDNAVFYSLLESCDIVGADKWEWMTHVLGQPLEDMQEDELVKLLPYNYRKVRE
jgi:transposase